jgi:glycogen operon protein
LSAFFDIIQQDPIISQVKLIAEPWDVGEGGYQVGNFPTLWSEWNGRYRDSMRDFWCCHKQNLGEFAYRLTGSPDLYEYSSRRPTASINFITAHDGFTLEDLVSYNEKHNEANKENNQDGENYNRSWNCGVEGPTDDPHILTLRRKQKRNFLATLLFSQGVPMLLGGDEIGRSKYGNNNTYCQDNEISWLNWEKYDTELLDYTTRLIHFRRDNPVFHRRRWFQGRPIHNGGRIEDIKWFTPSGEEMLEAYWKEGVTNALGVYLNGEGFMKANTNGDKINCTSYYLIFNAHNEDTVFTLPCAECAQQWVKVMSTNEGWYDEATVEPITHGNQLKIESRSFLLLKRLV